MQGNAVGIGTTMLMHCDHVVASSDAHFATPFVGLGLVPEAASSLIAPRLMGQARAFSLLVMGRPLSADEAKAAIEAWIRRYNAVRLHSSLGYVPPIEWELNYRRSQLQQAA